MKQREIKFRAWHKNAREFTFMSFDISDYRMGWIIEHDGSRRFEDFVFNQFTGLRDKDGKEIYEGDILKKTYGTSIPMCAVAWHDERAMFIQHDGYNEPLCQLTPQHIEVVGNIYENAGLLAVAHLSNVF